MNLLAGPDEHSWRDEPGARARLARRIVFALFGLVLGIGLGLVAGAAQTQRYESTMQLLVGPVGADRSTLDASGLLSRTYADLLTSRNAVNRAADSLGVVVEEGDVTAIADDRSRIVLLVVRSDDRTVPPRLATALAADLILLVEGSQPGSDDSSTEDTNPGQVRVLDDATDPALPLAARSTLTILGAGLAGLCLGLALGLTEPRSRRSPSDRHYLELLGLDVVSMTHAATNTGRRGLRKRLGSGSRSSPDEEDLVFQQLLVRCAEGGDFRTILFIPADADVERELPAALLMLSRAGDRLGSPVQIADTDPERYMLAKLIDTEARILVDPPDYEPESGIRRISRLAEQSGERLLLLISPTIGSSVRALTGAPAVDRIVLVARSGKTERRHVRSALQDLATLGLEPSAVLELGGRSLEIDTTPPVVPPLLADDGSEEPPVDEVVLIGAPDDEEPSSGSAPEPADEPSSSDEDAAADGAGSEAVIDGADDGVEVPIDAEDDGERGSGDVEPDEPDEAVDIAQDLESESVSEENWTLIRRRPSTL